MPHHRYINLSLGLEKDPAAGKAGGEPGKATRDETARALAAVKRRFDGLKFDGYVIAEISDQDAKSRT